MFYRSLDVTSNLLSVTPGIVEKNYLLVKMNPIFSLTRRVKQRFKRHKSLQDNNLRFFGDCVHCVLFFHQVLFLRDHSVRNWIKFEELYVGMFDDVKTTNVFVNVIQL